MAKTRVNRYSKEKKKRRTTRRVYKRRRGGNSENLPYDKQYTHMVDASKYIPSSK